MYRPWHQRRYLPFWNVPRVGKARFRKGTRVPLLLFFIFSPTTTHRSPEASKARVKMATDVGARSKHTPAEREYLDNLSARQLMDFRDYVFSATYIARNAGKFLDHEWIDIALLRKYLGQPQNSALLDASMTLRAEIEVPLPSVAPATLLVKGEPQAIRLPQASADIKMRALNDSGREVFELHSDSEPDADEPDSDLEVIHVSILKHNSSSRCVYTDEAHDVDSELNTSGTASGLPSDGTKSFIFAGKYSPSTALTKTLKAQIKVAKETSSKRKKKSDETSVILSASSSGRVKTARGQEEPPIPVRATQSDNPSSATGAATHSAEPSIPELYSAQPAPNYFLNDFDFDTVMCSLEGGDTSSSAHGLASAELSAFAPAFDPTLFGMSAEWNPLMPFSAPPEDPVQDFMNLYGLSAMFSDAGAPADLGTFTSTGLSDDPLPLLPPPPPESPPAPSPAVDQVSEAGPSAPRPRCSRQEVDEANILHSRRARAPTKQFADGDLSTRPQKKAKGKQVPEKCYCAFRVARPCNGRTNFLEDAAIKPGRQGLDTSLECAGFPSSPAHPRQNVTSIRREYAGLEGMCLACGRMYRAWNVPAVRVSLVPSLPGPKRSIDDINTFESSPYARESV
ncbi:hypothetical protein DFH09DRAFT_1282546 [Mycena vulgaris]|nr:hypothetical protein DFH09DRAFT_1282546 [Mycena vulgaris]